MKRLLRLFVVVPFVACLPFVLTGPNPADAQKGAGKQPKLNLYNKLHPKKGFKIEKLYSVPAKTQGSWVSMTVDPKGRLITSDQYGKLFRVTPAGVNGAKKTKVETIPVNMGFAHGLLWAFDSLYVMVNRSRGPFTTGLYRLTDTNNDDRLDKIELLRKLKGRGEHGPHAIVLSPDKKSLYVVAGNHTDPTKFDKTLSPRVWAEDNLMPGLFDATGHAVTRTAPGGWIARIDPDGKNWTLFCHGFRNEYDIAFNADGELFTYDSDMEWDMSTPWYRPTRVCHCVSGAEFGWRRGTTKFPTYYPDNLPPVIDIGPGSPTGVVFGYGAKFPAKYQKAFYICDWSYGKLYAIHMTPTGSTYKGKKEEFITGTPLPLTDIVINPKDGAMYFTTGGRRTESALYRVTYVGDESTAPVKFTKDDTKESKLRAIRHRLESFHGKTDPRAVHIAWPYLSHDDRFIRYAARTALEHQPAKTWKQKVFDEKNPQALLTSALALTRTGAKSDKPELLKALDLLSWEQLSRFQKFSLLRVYSLAFTRMGDVTKDVREKLIAKFDPHYPANDRELDDELCKMLVYLQAPNTAKKTLKLIRGALTQEEEMQYALTLRHLKAGWNMDLRKEYFRWFVKAANYKGGNSFQGFVRNIKRDAVKHLSREQKVALRPILNATPPPKKLEIVTNRKFVRDWKVSDLAGDLNEGLRKRNFNRGRKMFAEANCFVCHRFANEGGSTGPDLTGVGGRFSPKDLLESIIEPNKTISDQYETVSILTKNGKIVTGRIVNLSGNTLRVMTNMLDPNGLVNVNRNNIQAMRPSPTSMMPADLLNTLNREEILDLMAYMLSGGNRNHPMFGKK